MRPKVLLQSVTALATVSAILYFLVNPGCQQATDVREAAERLIEKGKQAGIFGHIAKQ